MSSEASRVGCGRSSWQTRDREVWGQVIRATHAAGETNKEHQAQRACLGPCSERVGSREVREGAVTMAPGYHLKLQLQHSISDQKGIRT